MTYRIPSNASVPYTLGVKIEIVNGSTSMTLAITSDSLLWCPTLATGSRTLATGAICTITKVTATQWFLVGVGIS